MITAATVALIAGTSFANAQGTGSNREGPSGGSAIQSQAPTGNSAAPAATEPNKPSGMKATQSEDKMQGSKNQRAQDMKSGDTKSGVKDEKSAQENNIKGEKSKGMSSQNEKGPASKDMKAEGREDRDRMKAEGREDRDRGNMKAEGREDRDRMKAEGREGSETRSQTIGQAGAAAKLSTEQRTRITTVIRDQHVAPLNNVNFSIAIGARIPREVTFHRLPAEIVSIYPEWRGYEYILVRDQILVVDPRTFEVVAILDV